MKGSLERLPKTNRWVQLGDTLPWAEYEKVYNKRLRNDHVGAGNRPGRMVIAALIIKHKLSLSDEETILTIQENPYMQYMCGLTEYSDQPIFDPSLFTTIRKRITIEDINALTLELAKKARQIKEKEDKKDSGNDKGGNSVAADKTQPTDVKADATCADAEVRYPTDIDLVEDGSKYIDRMIDKVCGIKKIRKPAGVERNRIRAIYLNVIKRKHKGSKLIKDALSRMLPLLYRDILTLLNLSEWMTRHTADSTVHRSGPYRPSSTCITSRRRCCARVSTRAKTALSVSISLMSVPLYEAKPKPRWSSVQRLASVSSAAIPL